MNLFPENIKNKKILIAPLDWGMGHVTRCIPLINLFLENDNQIVFAGTEEQINLIDKDFPNLLTEEIKGYNINLDSGKSTYFQIIKQSKKIRNIVKHERSIANDLAKKHMIDIIVSDNRYGFYSDSCDNIFITHQLNLQIPFFQKATNRSLRKLITKFDICWVPDDEDNPICGALIEYEGTEKIKFIGLLSRFKKLNIDINNKYLLILSGPEPERSRFARKICDALKTCNQNYLVVGTNKGFEDGNFIHNPDTKELEILISRSEIVISRAGYTSIMELISLKKNSVLIPTKGQYEQEFLSKTIKNEFIKFMNEEELITYLFDK